MDDEQTLVPHEQVLASQEQVLHGKKDLICQDCNDLFKVDQVYESPNHLKEALEEFASTYSFSVFRDGTKIACRRAGTSKCKGPDSKRKTSSFKVGCPFRVSFNYVDIVPKHLLPVGKENKKITTSERVKITNINAMHCKECLLTKHELQAVLRRGGELSKFQSGGIATVVNAVNSDPKFPASSIRTVLRPHLPPGLELTPSDVCNFRIWCRKNAHKLQEQGEAITFNPTEIGTTLKQWSRDDNPPSMAEAGGILRDVLGSLLADSSNMWKVEAYLRKLKEKDDGFDYRIATNSNGVAQGVVWQNSFMRANFKLFGETIFLDACKRKLNHLHWPYIGPVVIDSDNHIQVVCESICCGELVDAYAFVMRSLLSFDCLYAFFLL